MQDFNHATFKSLGGAFRNVCDIALIHVGWEYGCLARYNINALVLACAWTVPDIGRMACAGTLSDMGWLGRIHYRHSGLFPAHHPCLSSRNVRHIIRLDRLCGKKISSVNTQSCFSSAQDCRGQVLQSPAVLAPKTTTPLNKKEADNPGVRVRIAASD